MLLLMLKKEFKKGKLNSRKVDDARKNATILINDLVEYSQRKDLMALEKSRFRLKYSGDGKERIAELIISDGKGFLIRDNTIKKITTKIEDSNMKDLSDAVEKQKSTKNLQLNPKIFELLKKELGDYEIVL